MNNEQNKIKIIDNKDEHKDKHIRRHKRYKIRKFWNKKLELKISCIAKNIKYTCKTFKKVANLLHN